MADGATKERVGIVGVGRMGLAMLKHLVKHGYQATHGWEVRLTGWSGLILH